MGHRIKPFNDLGKSTTRLNIEPKKRGVVLRNRSVEEDGVAEPLFDLSHAPRNKHLALLYYFHKLADNPNTVASFDYIQELIVAGADVNAPDRIGQRVLHEVARDWGEDIAQYLIEKGAQVDVADSQGRTPLHIACRTENTSVVRTLLRKGADVSVVTLGELQSPLHYAARHDAAEVIDVLVEHGAQVNPTDFKGRTPLLLAAELDRSVAALKLLEHDAKAGIIDKTGLHTLCAMVEKMPGVALKALDQFHVTNRGSRQQFFFLNYLEPDPDIDELTFNMSVLGAIVSARELKLMNHPVIRKMIKVKWRKFGQMRCLVNLLLYGVYLVSWTCVVFIYQPWRLEQLKSSANSSSKDAANIASVCIAVVLFIYLLIEELRDLHRSSVNHARYKEWRSKQILRDLQYVPDKQSEERNYILNQAQIVRESTSPYSLDAWNYYDWLTYFSMLLTSTCVLVCLYSTKLREKHEKEYSVFALWTSRFMCVTLLLIWIKLFKYVRVYSFLGPFVVILVRTISDLIKILFVFVVFFVPTVAIFYQFYYQEDDQNFGGLAQTIFTVYRMLLVDDYGYDNIRDLEFSVHNSTVKVKPETGWTDFVVSYWLLFGAIIILNLFIALMSDTFQRVYDNALEVALLERATIICSISDSLPNKRKRGFLRYLKEKCAPLEDYYDDDVTQDDEDDVKKLTEQTYESVRAIEEDMVEWKEQLSEELKSVTSAVTIATSTQQQQIAQLAVTVEQLTRILERNHRTNK